MGKALDFRYAQVSTVRLGYDGLRAICRNARLIQLSPRSHYVARYPFERALSRRAPQRPGLLFHRKCNYVCFSYYFYWELSDGKNVMDVEEFEQKMKTSQIRPKNVILPVSNMMYPFMTLDDNAEIVHSEMGKDGRVKVYIEKPDAKDGFHRATCYLPSYTWEDIFGFSDEEIDRYKKVIESTAHLIMEFSQKGGFSNAANL